MPDLATIARTYIHRGWVPIPIPHMAKKPLGDGWQNLRITEADLGQHFNGEPQNIGVVLGPASGGLSDVDLDCPEAIAVAPYLLPKTGAMFGRKTARDSHRLYRTGDFWRQKSRHTFNDPCVSGTDGMILELR